MSITSDKIARMKSLAQSVGAVSVAAAPSKRPPLNFNKMRSRAVDTMNAEIMRIVNVPVRYELTEDDLEAVSKHYFQAEAFIKGGRLLPKQAESLIAFNDTGGAFLPLAVGGGKTLTSLLIANDAYHGGMDKIMIIVPPSLATQLCDTDIKHWRPRTIFNTPIHRIAGLSKSKRKLLANSGRRGLYIYTYSLLSQPDAHEILDAISPDLIILDEAHSVSKKSARARRFNKYLNEKRPKVVALSGTMTQKMLTDYFELARAALGDNNFLPNSRSLTEEWSKIIDSSATSLSDFRNDTLPKAGPLKYILNWARENFPEETFDGGVKGFRNVFQKRLTTTPGVVCSSGDDLPYSLYIKNEPIPHPEKYEGWDKLRELVQQLEQEWLTPNGDEIEEAMHLFRWKYWIEGAGFYTEQYWPDIDWMMRREKYASVADAKDILKRSQQYHSCHLGYQRNLRAWITDRARAGLDTPMLIGKDMSIHGYKNVGYDLFCSWREWKDSDFERRIDRNKRAIRVCGFKVEKAVEWAKNLPKGEGGLIWYDNDEMGDWVYERAVEEGLDPLLCKAGKVSNVLLNQPDKCRGRLIILTVNAHGTGKNLQFDHNMFYLQWPRSAKTAEQSLGRQHRMEQEYDEVNVTTCFTTEFDRVLFGATLNDAAYVHQSQGNAQKIIYATHTPMPEVVPFEILQEWGAKPGVTTSEARDLLEDRFGN